MAGETLPVFSVFLMHDNRQGLENLVFRNHCYSLHWLTTAQLL